MDVASGLFFQLHRITAPPTISPVSTYSMSKRNLRELGNTSERRFYLKPVLISLTLPDAKKQ
jgi:hypothetical protein